MDKKTIDTIYCSIAIIKWVDKFRVKINERL